MTHHEHSPNKKSRGALLHDERVYNRTTPDRPANDDPSVPIEPDTTFNTFDEEMLAKENAQKEVAAEDGSDPALHESSIRSRIEAEEKRLKALEHVIRTQQDTLNGLITLASLQDKNFRTKEKTAGLKELEEFDREMRATDKEIKEAKAFLETLNDDRENTESLIEILRRLPLDKNNR